MLILDLLGSRKPKRIEEKWKDVNQTPLLFVQTTIVQGLQGNDFNRRRMVFNEPMKPGS